MFIKVFSLNNIMETVGVYSEVITEFCTLFYVSRNVIIRAQDSKP
jgi:hypothetical protein